MNPAKILGVLGSPRYKGNSHLLLEEFLRGASRAGAVTRQIILEDLRYSPCKACGGCHNTGRCVIQDDMQGIYAEVEEADGLVLAAPVHFGSISARAKMAIDRFQCFWAAKYLLKKPRINPSDGRLGFFICVGGMKNPRFCENAMEIAQVFFRIANLTLAGNLMYREVDTLGDIQRHPTALREAFTAGWEFAGQVSSTGKALNDDASANECHDECP